MFTLTKEQRDWIAFVTEQVLYCAALWYGGYPRFKPH